MSSVESEGKEVRRQLERVLESEGFASNDRLSGFLRFVVERHLEGRHHELKESVIANEVFGRRPDYSPKRDPVVRTEAQRLRARLSEYYMGEGRGDALVIEVPKGGYTPVFRQAEQPPATVAARVNARPKRLSLRLWLTIALACFVVLAVLGWWRFRPPNAAIPIAVLPLNDVSESSTNDYFADGLTYEIIRNLSIIDGLAVRSQTSSFTIKGKPQNAREAGRQLAADYILEGSVLRSGQQLRINAQLIRVRDDFPLWSGRYDRELTDIFAIQDEISRGIVNSLRLKLGRGRRRYETSVEAYDLYLRARASPIFSGGRGSLDQHIARFEQVAAKDPSFAPAWAGLAATYAIRSDQYALDHPADELPKMRAAAKRAIQLDPLLAEAHDALGMVYARDGQWKESEKSFHRAIELDPNRSETHVNFAWSLLLVLDRVQEALAQMRVAE